MNVLSLFDGISAGRLALQRAGINVSTYYRAEIDKYANQVALHHYPNDVQLGDVTKWREWDIDWASIDLISAGFPCQSWSVAGQQLGDRDARGMLFWTTLEIIKHVLSFNPNAKFLMENVKMKKDFEEYITYHTGAAVGYVEKTLINSALLSAQNRNRYYWTNFPVPQPEDKGILLKDILEGEPEYLYSDLEKDIRAGVVSSEQNLNGASQTMRRALSNGKNPEQKANSLTACAYKGMQTNGMTNILVKNDNVVVRATVQANAEHTYNGKVPTLTAAMGVGGGNVPLLTDSETASQYKGKYIDKNARLEYRKLTPIECERLQTFPDNWTDCVSNTQRYKALGNAWTVDVIAHILKYLPRPSRLSYEPCPKVKDSLIVRRRACSAQTGGGNLMLTFYITAALKAVIDDGATALLVAVADFNHTDIILLHDEEVADEIEKALHSRRRPVWLTLYTNDEFFGDDNDT